jgi:hypothetical protein
MNPEIHARHQAGSLSSGAVQPAETTHVHGGQNARASAGMLLDLRAGSTEASLRLLTAAAAATLSDVIGSTVDCAVSLCRPGKALLVVGTSDAAVGVAEADAESGDGPVCQALGGRLGLIVNSYVADPRWTGYWCTLGQAGYRSIVSVPMPVGSGHSAALTLVSGKDNVFNCGAIAASTSFTKRAGSSLAVAEDLRTVVATAEQLGSALAGRTSIDVACGVIMGQNRCSYDQAFQILAKASSHRNIKLRVVADSILDSVPGGAPGTHFAR